MICELDKDENKLLINDKILDPAVKYIGKQLYPYVLTLTIIMAMLMLLMLYFFKTLHKVNIQ